MSTGESRRSEPCQEQFYRRADYLPQQLPIGHSRLSAGSCGVSRWTHDAQLTYANHRRLVRQPPLRGSL